MQKGENFMWEKIQTFFNDINNKVAFEIGIVNNNLKILASTNKSRIGMILENDNILKTLDVVNQEVINLYFCCEKEDNLIIDIVYSSVKNIYFLSQDKFKKDKFIKDAIYDKLTKDDIIFKCKQFKIEEEISRIVFAISIPAKSEDAVSEILKNMFPNTAKEFVVKTSTDHIAVIKEIKKGEAINRVNDIAKSIVANISADAMQNVKVGIGGITNSFSNISRSYNQAKTALLIGDIFEEEKNIINFYQLGLGNLIYQLPISFCRVFLEEILNNHKMDLFDDETLVTIVKFFENNLNISETARKLYIHRNTLIYRLDKIQKQIGLDLKNFDNAVIFKIAILVNKYIKYKEKIARSEYDDRI